MFRLQNCPKKAFSIPIIAVACIVLPLLALAGAQQLAQERKYEVLDKSFPEGALKITKTNNLQSTSFPDDFEIEVENISGKPIYFISVAIVMANAKDIRTSKPQSYMFKMTYGDRRLVNFKEEITAKDLPLESGQKVILKTNTKSPPDWADKEKRFEETRSFTIIPQVVNFGDGSGHVNAEFHSTDRASTIKSDGGGCGCQRVTFFNYESGCRVYGGRVDDAQYIGFPNDPCVEIKLFPITCYEDGVPFSCNDAVGMPCPMIE